MSGPRRRPLVTGRFERADDAGGHRAGEPERRADGDDGLRRPQARRSCRGRGAEAVTPFACTTAMSSAGARPTIVAGRGAAVVEQDRIAPARRGRDDVVVGQDQAVGREHDPRALAGRPADLHRAGQHVGRDRLDRPGLRVGGPLVRHGLVEGGALRGARRAADPAERDGRQGAADEARDQRQGDQREGARAAAGAGSVRRPRGSAAAPAAARVTGVPAGRGGGPRARGAPAVATLIGRRALPGAAVAALSASLAAPRPPPCPP